MSFCVHILQCPAAHPTRHRMQGGVQAARLHAVD
jgi:hypothetical protein